MPEAFVFEAGKCTGCQACQLACTIQNDLAPDHSYRQVMTFNARRHPAAPLFHLSLACNHCADPACLAACPALAYRKDPTTGAVLLDEEKCIGCRYCTWACPYDAPRFDAASGVMTKCNFCQERLLAGQQPACVELCPTGALGHAQLLTEELTAVAEGLPTTDLGPSLRIIPLAPGRQLPEMPGPRPAAPFVPWGEQVPQRITLRAEWTLAGFTLLTAALVGLAGALLGGAVAVTPLLFGGLGLAGLVVSASHLGRKARAWRSALNLGSSWLSREVVGYGLFVTLATAAFWVAPVPAWTAGAVLAVGLLTLFVVDCVYGYTQAPQAQKALKAPGWHSASVLGTGLLLLACVLDLPPLAAVVALAKLVFYLRRLAGGQVRGRFWLAAVRVGIGLLLPAELWWRGVASGGAWVLSAILLGEIVDRCQFYSERQTISPQAQMDRDLARRLEAEG